MVYITGDMHGDLSRFKDPVFKKMKAGDVLIVCGDFGFIWDGSRQEQMALRKLREKPFTIAFVDGCHENFDILEHRFRTVRWRGGMAHLIAPNIFHMMRGEIFTIDDRTFFWHLAAAQSGISNSGRAPATGGSRTAHAQRDSPCHPQSKFARCKGGLHYHTRAACFSEGLFGCGHAAASEIHTFFEDIIKQCEYRKWFFGKCHMDRFIPMKFYAMFEDVLPVEPEDWKTPVKKPAKKKKKKAE